jgi:hypothetical protein
MVLSGHNPTAPTFVRFGTRADKAEIYLKAVVACRTVVTDNQRGDPMTKPIPDKAEIALEYLDKLYVGTFERSSRFETHLDPTGIALILERPGADDIPQINSHAYQLWPVR